MRLSVGTKLIGTYLAVIALMVAPVVGIGYYLHYVRKSQAHVLAVAQPAAAAAKGVREGLHQSGAGLRGYLSVGGEQFRDQQERGLRQAQQCLKQLDALTQPGTIEDRQSMDQLRSELGDITAIHQAMQTAPRHTSELPAIQKLAGDTTPLGERMLQSMNTLIDAESKLEKTPQRAKLLEQMTTLRSALHGSLVEMHSYLSTAEERHIKHFGEQWRSASSGLAGLTAQRRMLTPEQARELAQVERLIGQFQPLPDRLFAMRKSESWNIAQQRVKDEAAPREARAEELLGTIIQRAEARARQSERTLQAQSAWLGLATVGGPGAAAVLGILFGWMVTRRVARRLQQTVRALEAVAAGDLTARLPATTQDEFGRLAAAINSIATMRKERATSAAAQQDFSPRLNTERLRSLVDADANHRRLHVRPQAAPTRSLAGAGVGGTSFASQEARETAQPTQLQHTLRSFQSALGQIVATANQLAEGTRQVAASSQQVQAQAASTTMVEQPLFVETLSARNVAQGDAEQPELSNDTEKLAVSSERLRNQAAQLGQLMQRLQQGLSEMPRSVEEAHAADTNVHGAARHLAGPKAPHGVKSLAMQTT